MPVKGIPDFDGLAILQIDAIDFSTTDVRLVAHAAFVNLTNGNTYGETTLSRWSKKTLELLASLRDSMEQDVAAVVFVQDTTGPAVGRAESLANKPPVGIGEHAAPMQEAGSI
jgi:hypothetical protein